MCDECVAAVVSTLRGPNAQTLPSNAVEALKISAAIRTGRVEKWVVHTDPAGGTSIWIVDSAGKIVKADSRVTSKVLGGKK